MCESEKENYGTQKYGEIELSSRKEAIQQNRNMPKRITKREQIAKM